MGAWAGWFQEQVLNDANIHKIGYYKEEYSPQYLMKCFEGLT